MIFCQKHELVPGPCECRRYQGVNYLKYFHFDTIIDGKPDSILIGHTFIRKLHVLYLFSTLNRYVPQAVTIASRWAPPAPGHLRRPAEHFPCIQNSWLEPTVPAEEIQILQYRQRKGVILWKSV